MPKPIAWNPYYKSRFGELGLDPDKCLAGESAKDCINRLKGGYEESIKKGLSPTDARELEQLRQEKAERDQAEIESREATIAEQQQVIQGLNKKIENLNNDLETAGHQLKEAELLIEDVKKQAFNKGYQTGYSKRREEEKKERAIRQQQQQEKQAIENKGKALCKVCENLGLQVFVKNDDQSWAEHYLKAHEEDDFLCEWANSVLNDEDEEEETDDRGILARIFG